MQQNLNFYQQHPGVLFVVFTVSLIVTACLCYRKGRSVTIKIVHESIANMFSNNVLVRPFSDGNYEKIKGYFQKLPTELQSVFAKEILERLLWLEIIYIKENCATFAPIAQAIRTTLDFNVPQNALDFNEYAADLIWEYMHQAEEKYSLGDLIIVRDNIERIFNGPCSISGRNYLQPIGGSRSTAQLIKACESKMVKVLMKMSTNLFNSTEDDVQKVVSLYEGMGSRWYLTEKLNTEFLSKVIEYLDSKCREITPETIKNADFEKKFFPITRLSNKLSGIIKAREKTQLVG